MGHARFTLVAASAPWCMPEDERNGFVSGFLGGGAADALRGYASPYGDDGECPEFLMKPDVASAGAFTLLLLGATKLDYDSNGPGITPGTRTADLTFYRRLPWLLSTYRDWNAMVAARRAHTKNWIDANGPDWIDQYELGAIPLVAGTPDPAGLASFIFRFCTLAWNRWDRRMERYDLYRPGCETDDPNERLDTWERLFDEYKSHDEPLELLFEDWWDNVATVQMRMP